MQRDDKRFICSICERSFNRNFHLWSHIVRVHHGDIEATARVSQTPIPYPSSTATPSLLPEHDDLEASIIILITRSLLLQYSMMPTASTITTTTGRYPFFSISETSTAFHYQILFNFAYRMYAKCHCVKMESLIFNDHIVSRDRCAGTAEDYCISTTFPVARDFQKYCSG